MRAKYEQVSAPGAAPGDCCMELHLLQQETVPSEMSAGARTIGEACYESCACRLANILLLGLTAQTIHLPLQQPIRAFALATTIRHS